MCIIDYNRRRYTCGSCIFQERHRGGKLFDYKVLLLRKGEMKQKSDLSNLTFREALAMLLALKEREIFLLQDQAYQYAFVSQNQPDREPE